MAHNHSGPPSTSAYIAGCRDGRCIARWETWVATKPADQQPARTVVTVAATPATPPPPPPPALAPVPFVAQAKLPELPEPPETVVPDVEYVPSGGHFLDSIRTIRSTRIS